MFLLNIYLKKTEKQNPKPIGFLVVAQYLSEKKTKTILKKT
jgi:hypothetical protein